ncbi:MAG TPA: ABC transporter permease [Hanamia sp.]|nr:ABC transporter permease [Hanamia sp.]
MFKNYFKTALRTFRKNKVTTFINVLGLSIGISAALIIFMVIQYDFSFDKYEPGKESIYRIVTDGDGWKNSGVPVPLHQNMQSISGIQNISAILQFNDNNAKVSIPQGNNNTARVFKKQEGIVFTGNGYFLIFPHQWIAGNKNTALTNPYKVVLSESYAKRYFPGISPEKLIGKTVAFSDTILTTITGIVQDLKANSDFEYKIFISLPTIVSANLKENYSWNEWGNTNSNFQTIVKLSPSVQAAQINKQIAAVFNAHSSGPDDRKTIHRLQPLSDVHTNTELGGEVDMSTVRNLILLAVFLLLLGAINFINLSTAQATQRAKEIGIRKTLGSKKNQLILQFLSETFLLTLFTAIVSVAITPLLLKAFTGFIPEGLHFSYLYTQPVIWFFFFLLIAGVSIIAGLYPAFILTKFNPVAVLKNNVVTNTGVTRSAWMRKTLIVFQFIIAQVFIIAVLVVNKQIHYSLQKDMGFRKDAIINFYVPFDFFKPDNKKFVLKEEVSKIPEIQEVSLGNQSPAFSGQMSTQVSYKDKGKEVKLQVDSRNGDTAFLSVYDIKLIAGRNILPSDSATEFLINETLARQLGFKNPAEAIGHFLDFGNSQKPIVGVMKDFNLASVRSVIHPLIYYAAPKFGYVMHIALQPNPATWNTAINKMQAAWKSIYPDVDFDYTFLDKKIENFYKADQQLSKLLAWASVVAVIISCLGLLGLVIFITNKRIKEIGVRKILGASVRQIITLLSFDFVKLIAVAFVIAIPIAWWATHNWLQNFAYHTNLSWWIFLLSGIIMITTALAILCIRAGRAAMANPVKSLRTE